MGEVGAFFAFVFVADAQATGLVVGTVAGARHFAVFAVLAATRHPGFQVELAVGRSAQIAAGGVDHTIRNTQSIEDFTFQPAEVIERFIALLRQRERKHFDFRKLMHAVESTSRPTMRTASVR